MSSLKGALFLRGDFSRAYIFQYVGSFFYPLSFSRPVFVFSWLKARKRRGREKEKKKGESRDWRGPNKFLRSALTPRWCFDKVFSSWLNHYHISGQSMFHFYTSWKHAKTRGFLMFTGGNKKTLAWYWLKLAS